MKKINRKEWSLIQKDFKEIWNEKNIRVRMLLLPVLLAVVVPFAFLLAALLSPQKADGMEFLSLRKLAPDLMENYNVRQCIFFSALDFVMPLLFLLIPVFMGGMVSAVLFAGERERGTFETLLLSPVSPKKLGQIKWICSVGIALLITLASFLLTTIISAVGDIILEIRFFLDLSWLITAFLIAPLLCVMAVLLTAFCARRGKSQGEAYKIVYPLLLPLVLLYMLPFTGAADLSPLLLLILAVLLAVGDFFLIKNGEKGFTAEKLMM